MKVQLTWKKEKMDELSHRLENIIFQRQESGILHNSFLWFEGIFEAVCSGEEERVQKVIEQEIRLEGEAGVLAKERVRSLKNLVICSVANLSFRIIREQILDAEMAYSISDACIQMVEETKGEEEIFEIAAASCLIFCRYVKCKNLGYHPLVRQAKEYVFKHFHEKIVIEQMAEQIGTSATYLGIVFKKSEGITLHEFIVQEKIERAKNLLRYSEYELMTIAQYLGFASQSHFGTAFKKYTGYTPSAYRSLNNHLYRSKL
jgi:AraC-like DNA-binding protein